MPFDRGDVVLLLFPDSNLRTAKRRPALVVQADNLQSGLAQTIVAMVTSNQSRVGHASRVAVTQSSPEGQQMGLRTDSVIMTDNLVTVLDNEIETVSELLSLDGCTPIGLWPERERSFTLIDTDNPDYSRRVCGVRLSALWCVPQANCRSTKCFANIERLPYVTHHQITACCTHPTIAMHNLG